MELDTICQCKIWSTGLLIIRCHPKWTPLGVLQQLWRGSGTWMILVYIKRPLTRQVRDLRVLPNRVRLTNVMRRSCRKRGQGSSRKRATRRVPRERRTRLRLSLVGVSSVEQQHSSGVDTTGDVRGTDEQPTDPVNG